nr:unnamed protein product [Callosobruchus analis]
MSCFGFGSWSGSGYGVTTDNIFTSLLLSKELLRQSKALTGTIRKRLLLHDLGRELVSPFIQSRPRQGLHKHIQIAIDIRVVLSDSPEDPADAEPAENQRKRGRCKICSRSSDRKFTSKCDRCKNFVCKEHYITKRQICCNSCGDLN